MSYEEYSPSYHKNYYPKTLFEAQAIYENGKRDERQDILDEFEKADASKKHKRLKTACHMLYRRSRHEELKVTSPRRETSLQTEASGSIRDFLKDAAGLFFLTAGLCCLFLFLGALL